MRTQTHRQTGRQSHVARCDSTLAVSRCPIGNLSTLNHLLTLALRPICAADLSAWESGLLDRCLEHGVGVVIGGAFNSGILATGAVEGAKFNYDDASPEIMAKTKKLEAVCQEFGVPLAAVALQFALGHPAVRSTV